MVINTTNILLHFLTNQIKTDFSNICIIPTLETYLSYFKNRKETETEISIFLRTGIKTGTVFFFETEPEPKP